MLRSESRCRSCGSHALAQVLDLGAQPMCDAFPLSGDDSTEPVWPLKVVLCEVCSLLQLSPDVPEVDEAPAGVASATVAAHVVTSVEALISRGLFGPGCTFAEYPTPHGARWQPELIKNGGTRGAASTSVDLVIDNHGLAHAPDVRTHVGQLASRMRPDACLIVEFHHLLPILRSGQFDAFRHGHYSYWSLSSFRAAASRVGLAVVDARRVDVYGGSLQLCVRRVGSAASVPTVHELDEEELAEGIADARRYRAFGAEAAATANALRHWLEEARAQGRRVVGYGAASRATPILCAAGIGADLLPFTADLAKSKHGRRIPGCGIPIVSPEALIAARPDVVLILAWDLAEEVSKQLDIIRTWGGRFAVPLPKLREWP